MTTMHDGPDPDRFRRLAAYGFNVFPLQPRGKTPLFSWRPYQLRRAQAVEIACWSCNPTSNVGIVCGPTSGNLVVLDIDSPEARAELERLYGPLPITPTVRTRNGWHLYLIDPSAKLRNFVGKIKGVDLRAMGGYVVGPGSIHPSGVEYRWEDGLSPDAVPLANVPPWLVELSQRRPPSEMPGKSWCANLAWLVADSCANPRVGRYVERALASAVFQVETAVPGTRNEALNRAAFSLGQLVGAGSIDHQTVVLALFQACLINGLIEEDGERSVRGTINSGINAGMRHPRDLSFLVPTVDRWGRPSPGGACR